MRSVIKHGIHVGVIPRSMLRTSPAKMTSVKCGEKLNNKLNGRELHKFVIRPAGNKYFSASNGYRQKNICRKKK
jgi:hypothetical protein